MDEIIGFLITIMLIINMFLIVLYFSLFFIVLNLAESKSDYVYNLLKEGQLKENVELQINNEMKALFYLNNSKVEIREISDVYTMNVEYRFILPSITLLNKEIVLGVK